MNSRIYVVILLLGQTIALSHAQSEDNTETTRLPPTCANMLCAPSTYCRTVVACSTCQPESRCIHIQEDTDTLCKNGHYSEAILIVNPNNSSSYSLLQCAVNDDTQKCPLGSDCVQNQAGSGSCCRGYIEPQPPTEKPGVCPSGDVSNCGGVMCKNDSQCPGAQKCCSGCGNMCTNPLCGNSACSLGETCVQKQRQCPPGSMCIQALQPTCVPDGCVKCAFNEDCNKTDSGYECIPYPQLDQCGGCPDGKVCIDTLIRCFQAPCNSFECVVPNECGGCPSGQVCQSTGTRCDQESCAGAYQCVPALEHPGTCPELQSGGFGICGPVCTVDDNCTSEQKCCPSACGGSTCTDAIPETPPALTCANVRCASGRYCRIVVSCATCQSVPRCVPEDNVQNDTDILCESKNYSEAILIENPNNSSSYSLLQCAVNDDAQKCPLGSDCVQNQAGSGSCCRGYIEPQPPTEKPGVCPSGDVSNCGEIMCKNDSQCPGAQKCCSVCGNMCTNPLCGNSACSLGETCVEKQSPCPPGSMCTQALQPTCVPDGCVECAFNEDCNQTDSGYECIPYPQLDQCGGCPDGKVCIDTLIRCVQAPCNSFECVVPNECGGCPSGQVCQSTGTRCEQESCAGAYQCVPALEHPGTCPELQSGGFGICGPVCTVDDNCTSEQKCCPSACGGSTCTDAIPETPPALTCANVRCASGRYCRAVVSCATCQTVPRCVPDDNVQNDTDTLCKSQNYSEAILIENPNNSSSYSLLQCAVNDDTQKCPLGSDCVQNQTGSGSCCRGYIEPQPPTEKPGVCPSGDVSNCGGIMCNNDSQCPGAQKCCPGCGNMCTNPLCGNSACSLGETCVEKQPPCPPGSMCTQALQPTCVPDGCVECAFNEDCNQTDSGYECIPYPQLDQCGGCPDGKVCIDTLIRCVQAPCNSFECVVPNECGGCPSGQVCQSTGTRCEQESCAGAFQCVPALEHPGTCPELQSGGFGICGPVCTVDDNCTSEQKCCPSACGGSTCTDAIPETPPALTCANVRCASGRYCRAVVSCATCQTVPRCVPDDNVQNDTDTLCKSQNYSEAILIVNPNNSSSYSLLQCAVNDDTQKCPLGSDCVQNQTGSGSCCRGYIEPQPSTEKPGVCPSGDVSNCGEVMCKNDSQCPGAQKCCPGCGNMCTNPLCGNSACSLGETCAEKQPPCPPGSMCTQALQPTCVPDGCVKCAFNEDCNQTDSGYECIPYPQLDQCGGCPDGKVCIDTLIRCVQAPCNSFECVVPNECGGCPSGQVCQSTGTRCDQESCAGAFQCVPALEHPGTCPELQSGGFGICGPVCTVDDNCTSEQKCCPSACGGSTCTNAIPETPPAVTCANVRCVSGRYCRAVVSCATCQSVPRCVPEDNVQNDTDTLCESKNYSEAILIENPNNSSSYSLLQCAVNDDTQKCPLGSDCVQNQAGSGSCCRGYIEPQPPTEKPGVCPSGDVSNCGGIIMCTNDSQCPGAQKCCSGCGNMCTNPLCGNSACSLGETCVEKQLQCPPGSMCIQALQPTCVPDGCVKCAFNEDCNQTDSGYDCIPYPQLDQCGGCPSGTVCADTGIRCVKAPCPESYQCMDGLNHPGTCPEFESGGFGICGPVCTVDDNCTSEQKCCPSACGGSTCTNAVPETPPAVTCANVRCVSGRYCRAVVSCATCQSVPRCVPEDNVQNDTDTLCESKNYSEAILIENPNNSSSYSLLRCAVNDDTQKCPLGSDCVQNQAGSGSCCRGYIEPQPPTEKPGVCPSGDVSNCGGIIMCTNDSQCPGAQKCCSGCGNMCTNPLCGNSACSLGETCVEKQLQCPPGSMCIQALQPTCVPDGCVKCAFNEDCNQTDSGYDCIPYPQLDQCGGCPSGMVCTDTGIRCVKAPCPESYQCMDGLNHLGTCPEFESGGFGICGPVCTVDDNCTSEQKCCPSACGGSTCTNAISETPPAVTCANVRCVSGRYCRAVVSCATCQSVPRCVPDDNVQNDTDTLCKNQNYSEAILIENPNNSSSYSLLQCAVNDDTQKCPLGSDCVQNQAGSGSCCRGYIEPQPPTEKPGVCPSGDVSNCGGIIMCTNDSQCPGAQKCCSGCGNMCTNPLCGNSACSLGETCVEKQLQCPPGSMCIQALQPTCVPDGCVKCAFNEDCNKTDSGYDCIPYPQLDQCGGCPSGMVCTDTGIRCVKAPCPESYQCMDGLNHPGTCPEFEAGEVGICGDLCTDDDNCTSNAKCCPSACGGTTCTITVHDPCWKFGCQNGGFCTAPADAPYCLCPSGYTGSYCEETEVVTPAPITCANMRCASWSYCRTVVSCPTCQAESRCILTDNVQNDTDTLCKNQDYSEAILIENPNNSSYYSLLQCAVNDDTQKCPLGSDCVQNQAGSGSCCRGYIEPQPPTEKPGVCPSGDVSVCGGKMCTNDSQCPGAQKCCSGCGNMCTNPLCGSSACSLGETCVEKHPPCPPRFMCTQALQPTCVPDGCAKCAFNEDCNKTDSGYECTPYQQLDQCGGCTDGKICINSGIVCIRAPCPTFQCVTPNECGGCPSGKVCKNTGARCDQAPCPSSYQCVPADECGGCPEGQACKDTGTSCNTTQCERFQCLPENEITCPLRCPTDYACQIKENVCIPVGRIMCIPVQVPTCVRIQPQFGSCPRVAFRLPPQSLYCKIEQLFFSCQDDSDCRGTRVKCCSSVCGSKKCTYVSRRTTNELLIY